MFSGREEAAVTKERGIGGQIHLRNTGLGGGGTESNKNIQG